MLQRRSTQLAVETLLLLALEPEGKCRRIRELAARLDTPATYLAKIVRDMTRLGLLRGVRGPGGGVRLARPAPEINLWEVLTVIEPVEELDRCFLKLSRCDDLHPCPLHEQWSPIRTQIIDMLKSKTLLEIAEEAQGKQVLGMKLAAGDP